MRILAIETSCDETALSLVEASGGLADPKFKILKSLVASQIKIHRPFGGVVPNLAKREHLKNLPILFRQIFKNSKSQITNYKQILNPKFKIPNIDVVAVTVGPGLEPALWTGINFAQEIYSNLQPKTNNQQLKLVGVNHLDGHLYSFLLAQKSSARGGSALGGKSSKLKTKSLFPAISLIVSGGHTELLLMKNLKTVEKLGETRDDAAGECFDKVARMLRLPYPGGPEVEKLAKKGNAEAITFPRPMLDQKNYDFSFSGLKTSVLYYLKDHDLKAKSYKLKADIAASFQKAVIDVLITKTMRVAREHGAQSIMVSGGVAANKELRRRFELEIKKSIETHRFKKLNLLIPDFKYCTDNADMIAAAAYISILRKKKYPLKANGNLDI